MTFTLILSPLEMKFYKPYCVQRVVKRAEFTRLFTLVLENTLENTSLSFINKTCSILFRMGIQTTNEIQTSYYTLHLISHKHYD